jgi:hypothetical protein
VGRGVLRAVRLLPDVVKIGIENETALPSAQEEEQNSKGPSPAEKNGSKNTSDPGPVP